MLIVGAGKAGSLLASSIQDTPDSLYNLVGFIDDDDTKLQRQISGGVVLGSIADIADIVRKTQSEEIIIAVPSERGELVRLIINKTEELHLSYKIMPRASEVLLEDFKGDFLKYIRKVRPEDFLGGEISKADQQKVAGFAKGKTVMVTGAAGSIGSELSRQIAGLDVERVVFYDWWENGIFDLRNQLLEMYPDGNFEFVIGDIKDHRRLNATMAKYKPHSIFHAAAYKHVPLMEDNPQEAIKNNIIGTKNVAELAIKNHVSKFILVSTDKAVNPTNIMGATKRTAEMLIHILAKSQQTTTFSAVRFGNVINSNGSAIPFFLKQIEKGGPVTVTHREMTRFFMTIPEAVHLILQCWLIGENNDLFVLDMGEEVKIYDLARTLIAIEGYVPEIEIPIKIVGLRPGEKLYEEVLVDEEGAAATMIKKVFRTQNYMNFDPSEFQVKLTALLDDISDDSPLTHTQIRKRMRDIVPTYRPSSDT